MEEQFIQEKVSSPYSLYPLDYSDIDYSFIRYCSLFLQA